jgi:FKBP-type peptidyl-prolyl cis-trans isomerase FklB
LANPPVLVSNGINALCEEVKMTHWLYKNPIVIIVAVAVIGSCIIPSQQMLAQDEKTPAIEKTDTDSTKKEADADVKVDANTDPKADPKADPKTDPKVDPKADPKTDPKADPKTDPEKPEAKPSPYKTLKEKISYIVGVNVGNLLKTQNVDPAEIDTAIILQGIKDALAGEKGKLNALERQTALLEYRKLLDEKAKKAAVAAKKKLADENLKKGIAFLEDIKKKKKDAIKSTKNGVLYEVVKTGKGASPKAGDTVTVHYVGTHIDGREFDSSRKRNEPSVFRLDQVISGWGEAIQLMKEGDRWTLYIPAKMGYGEDGKGPSIGANEVLIFDVELISVKPAAAPSK